MAAAAPESDIEALKPVQQVLPDALKNVLPHFVVKEPHANAACAGPKQEVRIGYEPGIPLLGGDVDTRAMAVLGSAFPNDCYELVFQSYRRQDLAASVVKGQVDIGVLAIASAASNAQLGVTSLPAADTAGVDVLMLHPASYSVVSKKPEEAKSISLEHSDTWLLLPLGILAGIAALAVGAFLLNFQIPRPARWGTHTSTRLDPKLSRPVSAAHWIYATTSGRLLALLWAGVGAIVAVQASATKQIATAALETEWHPLDGAELAAYPGRDIYELRDGRWKKCPRPFQCLRNYTHGDAEALAGDRDVLCSFAQRTHAATLNFVPDVAVPLLYALLLPAAPGEQPAPEKGFKDALLTALQRETYLGSPFRACDSAPVKVGVR